MREERVVTIAELSGMMKKKTKSSTIFTTIMITQNRGSLQILPPVLCLKDMFINLNAFKTNYANVSTANVERLKLNGANANAINLIRIIKMSNYKKTNLHAKIVNVPIVLVITVNVVLKSKNFKRMKKPVSVKIVIVLTANVWAVMVKIVSVGFLKWIPKIKSKSQRSRFIKRTNK